jgi:flagellar assembly protein FliH
MEKFRNQQVKSFEFSDLEATHVVSSNAFKPFEFQALVGDAAESNGISEDDIRAERNFAKKNNFTVDAVVSDSRGLSRQEQNDFEQRIQKEVQRRFDSAYEDAYREGLEKGRTEAREAAEAEFRGQLDRHVEEFAGAVDAIRTQSAAIVNANHAEIHEFVKRFTKWIVLREIDEKVYLEALLEKLILELNARKNLIVKVGRANFSRMPEVIAAVEGRLGQLTNVRLEIVPELAHPGIILEAENGLIDGSLEGVFKNIDKIFDQILGAESR